MISETVMSEVQGEVAHFRNGTTADGFAIPESVCQLKFDELPITKRLVNVLRSIGARTLGDMQGCTPFELLQYNACGWRTVGEIQQLVERAISGEFDYSHTEDCTVAAELLTLLERGIAKLSQRDKESLFFRMEGEMTYEEIGRCYGFTRAWTHQVVVKALDTLRKIWGPRIPRLLELIKQCCLSIPNGSRLTAALLEQWIGVPRRNQTKAGDSAKSFRLSRKAQLRLIAALDEDIGCYVETSPKASGPNKLDHDLASVARALRLATAPELLRSYAHDQGSPP